MIPGFFRSLFSRGWQHRDPAIRRQAVARLDPAQPEDRQRLERLADDPQAPVRQAALARLDDPARLLELDADSPELRARLVALLVGQTGAPSLSTRLALVERIDDPALLEQLAFQGDNQQLRLAALARLQDEEALIRQASDNGIAAVRRAAAERVTSPDGLARLSRGARRDKQIARLARKRLHHLREDAAEHEARQARRERTLQALEQHAQHVWEPLYAGRYRHLQREWEQIAHAASAEQERRYQEASLRCRKVISDHEARSHAIETADRQRHIADEQRREIIASLEEDLASLRRSEHIAAQDLDSVQAHRRLLANRWQSLSESHAPDHEARTRYNAALNEQERIHQAWKRLEQRAKGLDEALQQHDSEALRRLLAELDWPDDLPPSPLLAHAWQQLQEFSTQTEDVQTQAAHFATELDELEALLERGAFKPAHRLHQRLRQQQEGLSPAQRQAQQSRFKRLGARLAELRDWRGYVAGPKRQYLHQAIEELAEDHQLSDAQLDRRHRQLIKEWKDLGDAAIDRELSTRFRAASNRIHERLSPWRKRWEEQRRHNLEARRALCDQLESLLNNPDPQADPDALRQIRDRAREQWQRFSPVPREHSANIGHRFGHIRHALQTLIDQRAQEIAAAKRALIHKARDLQEASMPAAKRAEQAKLLQRRWRELGRAPKGEEQLLWREFRGVCDTIFAARENERDDRAQRAREQLDAMQALIDRLDAWQPATSNDRNVLDQAIDEAERLEPLPVGRRSEGMRRRWQGILRTQRERLSRLALNEEMQGWQQRLKPLLNAHLAADARALAGEAITTVDAPEALDTTLLQAHRQRNEARRTPPPETKVEADLARLRVHLALLAGSRIEQEDEPLRLEVQVRRLNGSRGGAPSLQEELHDILAALLATGPVAPTQWERVAGELDRELTQLTSH